MPKTLKMNLSGNICTKKLKFISFRYKFANKFLLLQLNNPIVLFQLKGF